MVLNPARSVSGVWGVRKAYARSLGEALWWPTSSTPSLVDATIPHTFAPTALDAGLPL